MNKNLFFIEFENHRSRDRIKDLGEVFTPDQYVQQMLETLDSKIWSDENTIFFEPSCGHGNFVLPILAKRISALATKFDRLKTDAPVLSAIATALNSMWAIDICPSNIELTRKRITHFVFNLLLQNGYSLKQAKIRDFMAHILCCLQWHIHENEALSSLSDETQAIRQASQTKLGREWISTNSHKPIDFESTWSEFFIQQTKRKATPIQFERALRIVEAVAQGTKVRGFEEFAFARECMTSEPIQHGPLGNEVGVA